jgi:hypothetical protein
VYETSGKETTKTVLTTARVKQTADNSNRWILDKLAATLFPRTRCRHFKMRRDDDTVILMLWLPSRNLDASHESEHDFRKRLSLNQFSRDDSSTIDDACIPKTARIRCLNAEALKACLRWYACNKFEEDVSYILTCTPGTIPNQTLILVSFKLCVWGDVREASQQIKGTQDIE